MVKHRYLDEWIQAVNAHGGLGAWRWAGSGLG
jgi:type III restriction enzyme